MLRFRQEERKTVVGRSGTQKIRSKSTSEFWEQVTAENAPASAILAFCLQKLGAETPNVCYVSRKNDTKKPSRPKRAEGGQASACRQTKGIFCESRIFEVIPRYVRTNITVSPGGLIDMFAQTSVWMSWGSKGKGEIAIFLPLGRPFGSFPTKRKGT